MGLRWKAAQLSNAGETGVNLSSAAVHLAAHRLRLDFGGISVSVLRWVSALRPSFSYSRNPWISAARAMPPRSTPFGASYAAIGGQIASPLSRLRLRPMPYNRLAAINSSPPIV